MRATYRELRATLMLAIPVTIGQVSQMLMGLVDSAMIGRTGTVPLAASSFGGSVFSVFFVIGIGFLTPVAIFVSRSRGARSLGDAGEYLRHGLAVACAAGVAGLAIIAAMSTRLDLFRQPPEVVEAVNPFLLLIGASLTPTLAYLALRQFAESMGRPWVSVIVILASVVLNAALNWVLIYGHLGFPPLGLAGAGVSTLIARTVSCVAIFLWLSRDERFRECWPKHWLAPLSSERIREMFSIGLPASVTLLFESGVFASATVIIGWLGAVPLASHQIAISCCALTFMIPLGLSISVGMRLSAAIGAEERYRLRPIWMGAAAISILCSVAFTLTFMLAGGSIARMFVNDPQVIRLSVVLMTVAGVFQIFDGAQVIHGGALRALGDVRWPTVITFIVYWVVALPTAYVLAFHTHLGVVGVWWGLALGLSLAAVTLGLRFLSKTRAA